MVVKNTDGRYTILYYQEVDIDGFNCRDEFVNLIRKTGSKRFYNVAHEWCCGHGAIGFRILESGLCRQLILTDKHPPAIVGCEFTKTLNNLDNSVSVFHSDDMGSLPNDRQWDLFVANPPWRSRVLPGPELSDSNYRKMFDVSWETHKNLYANISKYLTTDADCYIYEDSRFSDQTTWADMVSDAGLEIVDVYQNFGIVDTGYVLHLKPKI